jgi:hypothetical protein
VLAVYLLAVVEAVALAVLEQEPQEAAMVVPMQLVVRQLQTQVQVAVVVAHSNLIEQVVLAEVVSF